MNSLRDLAIALPFVLLAGCSSTSTSGGGENFDPIPEAELPEEASAAICELLFSCDCDDPGHATQAECEDAEAETQSESQAAAQAAGLTYDPECAGNLLGNFLENGCSPEIVLDCDTFCSPYHGNVPEDGACEAAGGEASYSDCAQGLLCFSGTCVDLCGDGDFLGEGEACSDGQESLGQCDPNANLICDFQTETCVALPGPGEDCYGGEVCAPGAVCDFQNGGVCIAAPKEGEACTFQCDVGLYCDGVDGQDGTCQSLPGEGEACTQFGQCAEGLECDGETCMGLPPAVCE